MNIAQHVTWPMPEDGGRASMYDSTANKLHSRKSTRPDHLITYCMANLVFPSNLKI